MELDKTTSPPDYTPPGDPNQFPGAPPPQYGYQQPPPHQPYGQQPSSQPYGQQPPPQPYGQPMAQQLLSGAPPVMVSTAAPRPQNHLLMSVLACLFCFWPTGIVAIVYSLQVDKHYSRGNIQGAMYSAQNAYKWAKTTIIVGMFISFLYGALVIVSTVLRFIVTS